MPGSADNEAPTSLTKGDRANFLRDMRLADREQSEGPRESMRRDGLDPDTGLPTSSNRKSPSSSSSSSSPNTSSGPGTVTVIQRAASSKAGGTMAGALLGGFVYFLGLATLRGGPAGARAWLAAKFLNKTASGS